MINDADFKSKSYQPTEEIGQLMAGCTRDIGFEITYQDKDGNKYGVSVEIKGAKESEQSNEIAHDDKPDSRDHDYE